MYKIVGVLEQSFSFDNNGQNRTVNGFHVYCIDDSRAKVDGVATIDFFMSESVSIRSNYIPKVGDCLDDICFNRFGKVSRVIFSSK